MLSHGKAMTFNKVKKSPNIMNFIINHKSYQLLVYAGSLQIHFQETDVV